MKVYDVECERCETGVAVPDWVDEAKSVPCPECGHENQVAGSPTTQVDAAAYGFEE